MTIESQRKENSKRRTPPVKGCVVSQADFEYLKMLHLNVANGKAVQLIPWDNNICPYYHAKELVDYFGFTKDEVFDATGFIIGEVSEG